MTVEAFAKLFDHTQLKAYASRADFEKLCDEGVRCGFMMLAVNPAAVEFCKRRVEKSGVRVGAAVGFPLGQNTLEAKIFETEDAIKKGADEIDYVINVAELKNKNTDYIKREMFFIVSVCRQHNVTSKVIFENCYLTDDEKITLCGIANEVRPDFIKTSTGFGTGGATAADVALMRRYADPGIKIKAAGGIKTLADVDALLAAGAVRIGTSSSVAIMGEFMGGNKI